jgi:hypothetical protein
VARTFVTHAMNAPVSMNVAEMKRAAILGALIEFVGGGALAPEAAARLDQFADAIRQVGPQFCVLASDLGRKGNPGGRLCDFPRRDAGQRIHRRGDCHDVASEPGTATRPAHRGLTRVANVVPADRASRPSALDRLLKQE